MKKLFSMLLAVVMCFSLVACAQAETNSNEAQEKNVQNTEQEDTQQKDTQQNEAEPQEETIEITIDNWQDYFEIKQCLGSYITTNDFDEPTGFSYDLTTFFTVKEEFVENVTSCDVTIEYDADVSAKNIAFNANDLSFEITGDYEGDIPELYCDSSLFTRGATAKLSNNHFYQHYFKDGKVEKNQISMLYSVIISGFDNDGISAKIIIDNDEEWKETNEGYINKYTENIKITRIEGTLVITR